MPSAGAVLQPDQGTPLQAVLAAKGYSYRDGAFVTGYSASYLNRLGTGKRQPSKRAALAIAKALGVSPRELWGDA